jgi:hypothetical protein
MAFAEDNDLAGLLPEQYEVEPEILRLVPEAVARRPMCLPLHRQGYPDFVRFHPDELLSTARFHGQCP